MVIDLKHFFSWNIHDLHDGNNNDGLGELNFDFSVAVHHLAWFNDPCVSMNSF